MTYWDERKDYGYYVLVKAWLESISCAHLEDDTYTSVLDVGPLDTPVATWGRFDARYTVDLEHDPRLPGVASFVEDFMTWGERSERLTVVTCLQVLEHLSDEMVLAFASKLRRIADHTIVSVPFMWPKGFEAGHKQDPISLEKLIEWMGSAPDEYAIIHDTRHLRIVARWKNP